MCRCMREENDDSAEIKELHLGPTSSLHSSENCILFAPLSSYQYPPSCFSLSFPLSSFPSPFSPHSSNPSSSLQSKKKLKRREEEAGQQTEGVAVLWKGQGGAGEYVWDGIGVGGGGVVLEWEWMRKKKSLMGGRRGVLIRRLRRSLCRQWCVVCFISAPLVLWDGVWVKASGHSLPWRVQWWMFRGNLGHCSRKTINSVAWSQDDWEELYCGMCLCICAQMCVPRNSIVFKKVCVCFKTHTGEWG